MPALPREQLEDFVTRWLAANHTAEAQGDWTGLADFYAPDATYGWNIGPKEDVMCVGVQEIREIALSLEMAGLEGWSYPYQKVLIDEKIGEVVGFWKQVATDAYGGTIRHLRNRRELVPAGRRRSDRVAAGLLRLRPRTEVVPEAHRGRETVSGHAGTHPAQHGGGKTARLLPTRAGTCADLVT